MNLESFILPLCLNCEVPLEEKIETVENEGLSYQVSYCPSCQEVYDQRIYEKK